MKSAISGQNRALVPVPNRGGTSTTHYNQSGTGTNFQNRVGTSTDLNGYGTTTPCSPDFLYFYIVKPKFIHR